MTSAEIAALSHATGPDGRFDALAFHAQRLILAHETLDGVDAKALAASFSALTPTDPPRDLVVEAVLARLDAANADRLRRLLVPQRKPPRTAARPSWLHSVLASLRPRFDHKTRWPEHKEIARLMTKARIRQARKETARAITALDTYVSRRGFLEEFVRNPDFRKIFIGLAQVYTDVDAVHSTKMTEDDVIRYAAAIALIYWRRDLIQAESEGREGQYLTELVDIGVDAMLCSVPLDDFWKFGGMAKSYFEAGIDFADPAVAAATKDASRAVLQTKP